jgi:uncharacterized protein YodC (DUF2158 family)
MAKFSSGDFVRLKLGGPAMIVHKVFLEPNAPPTYSCVWFDKEERIQHAALAEEILLKLNTAGDFNRPLYLRHA